MQKVKFYNINDKTKKIKGRKYENLLSKENKYLPEVIRNGRILTKR